MFVRFYTEDGVSDIYEAEKLSLPVYKTSFSPTSVYDTPSTLSVILADTSLASIEHVIRFSNLEDLLFLP